MSCRFQPDYRGDAMFRGDAMGRTEPCLDFTFDILDGFYVPSPTTGRLIPRDPFLNLACGDSLEGVEISGTSPHSLYRTTDRVTNQSFLARFFNTQIDDPDTCAVIITNVSGFSPYVTVHRSGTIQWQGVIDENDAFVFEVAAGQTGPMTIEVSSTDRRQKGSFDIELDCHYTVTVGPATIYLDPITYAAWLLLTPNAVRSFFRVAETPPFFSYVASNFLATSGVTNVAGGGLNYLTLHIEAVGDVFYQGVDQNDFLTVYNLQPIGPFGSFPPTASFSLTP